MAGWRVFAVMRIQSRHSSLRPTAAQGGAAAGAALAQGLEHRCAGECKQPTGLSLQGQSWGRCRAPPICPSTCLPACLPATASQVPAALAACKGLQPLPTCASALHHPLHPFTPGSWATFPPGQLCPPIAGSIHKWVASCALVYLCCRSPRALPCPALPCPALPCPVVWRNTSRLASGAKACQPCFFAVVRKLYHPNLVRRRLTHWTRSAGRCWQPWERQVAQNLLQASWQVETRLVEQLAAAAVAAAVRAPPRCAWSGRCFSFWPSSPCRCPPLGDVVPPPAL